ncbi:MAG: phosphoribosyltransferase [Thermoleophilia bacterium]
MFFENRQDAGERMVSLVEEYRGDPDALVLGLPRGGVVVALEIALALGLPLDVWVSRKIGAPLNPELAIGAVDSDGKLLLDDNSVKLYEISDRHIREMTEEQAQEVKRRYKRYRGKDEPPEVKGKTVLVVDDGVATGFTMLAALQSLRHRGAGKIICVIPVASPRIMRKLEQNAEAVKCLSTPSYFGAVGEFYRNFSQVSDEEVLECLEQARSGQN